MQRININYLALVLFVLSILFFYRTIAYKAVWDDERTHFTPLVQDKMDHHMGSFWKKQYGMYIPISYSTWGIVKRMASPNGFKPAPFHALNVIVHSINGVLLFFLLLLLFKNNTSAFIGSLLFLIHPLQVEAVSWIAEFRGVYAAFFCLISLLFFFHHLEKKRTEKVSELLFSRGFILSFLFFVLGLFSKPIVVILPFIILVLVWRFYPVKTKTVAISILTWFLPIFIVSFFLLVKGASVHTPVMERFVVAGYAIVFYLKKVIFPFPLALCYGYSLQVVVANPFSYVSLILSIGIISFVIYKRHTFPDLFAGILIIITCLLPVLGLIPFEYQKFSVVADRYMYMAFIGIAFLVPPIVKRMENNVSLKGGVVIVFVVLSILTIKQTAVWKDELTLWNHTLTHFRNNPKIYYNRGVQYSIKRDFEKAIADYTRALETDSTDTNILFNRANAYENLNDFEAAFHDYNVSLRINAKAGDVYYKRSHLFMMSGNLDKALDDLQMAEQYGFPVDTRYKDVLLNMKFAR
ncbi:MAG TPA: tetratricopeptide repeat protein [Bacteroidia bacterium]|jgi:hypothetical protein|nr:tetratricopeptide repeat protein [Bacteroidia bacterium]